MFSELCPLSFCQAPGCPGSQKDQGLSYNLYLQLKNVLLEKIN